MHPHTSYLILATPRSGSYLCCEALINTRLAGYPTEYFGPVETRVLLERFHSSNYAECFAQILKEGTTPNGVFGGKLMWHFHEDFVDRMRGIEGYEKLSIWEVLATAFPNLYYVWTTRRDKVRQAISYWKAIQTSTWMRMSAKDQQEVLPEIANGQAASSHIGGASRSWLSPMQEIAFDYRAIERLRHTIEQDEVEIQQYFSALGLHPFKVVYEDFVDRYEETALQILKYLHIPVSKNLVFGERRMQRQADEQSEEWLQRYYELKAGDMGESRRLGIWGRAEGWDKPSPYITGQ